MNRRDLFWIASSFFLAQPCLAVAQDSVADFYSKNDINLYVASGPGSFHLHSTLLAPYLTKHMPGNPDVIVHQMPGAAGTKAANFIYSIAPKDGTAIGNLLPQLAVSQAIGSPEVQYDAAQFGYLGSIAPINSVLATWNETTPAKTIEEMKQAEVTLGSSGPASVRRDNQSESSASIRMRTPLGGNAGRA